jgi:CRP-like cAMP-binding protein
VHWLILPATIALWLQGEIMSMIQGSGANLLLSRLSEETLARFDVRQEEHSLRQILLDAGEIPQSVFFPHPGSVTSIVRISVSGQMVEAGIVGAEGVFSVHTVLAAPAPTGSQAIVQSEGRFSRMSVATLRELFESEVPFREALLTYTSVFLDQVTQNLLCNRLHQIEQRLAKWLLMMRDRVGRNEMHLTQEFLGYMLGVHRPGVSLAVAAIEADGLIRHRRNWVEVCDVDGVIERACECYRPLHDKLRDFAASLD